MSSALRFLIITLRNKWVYLFVQWGLMGLLYFVFGGRFYQAPVTILVLVGVVFSVILLSPGAYADKVCVSILLSGGLLTVYTPVMDIPDETVHYARSLYVGDGHLYLPETPEGSAVADDIVDVEAVFKQPLVATDLEEEEVTSKTVVYPELMKTNGYAFLSYIPQTMGILLARGLRWSVFASLILGRFFNLLAYALLARWAIKKAGSHQYVLGTMAAFPMSIYIAASFNQDAVSNGLILLLIGWYCELLEKEQITFSQLFSFAGLSLLMATMKFPYVLLIGLLFFLPPKKMTVKKYGVVVLLVFLSAIASLAWLKLSSNINLAVVADTSQVNPAEKIGYTLTHLPSFLLSLAREIVYLIPTKLQSAFTFGWFTYGLDLVWLYIPFLFFVVAVAPRKKMLPIWGKVGLLVVACGITLGILLTAFLMWTAVTDFSFAGVQGRYFIGVFTLVGLVSYLPLGQNLSIRQEKKLEDVILFVANGFVLALILRTIIEYYL